MLIAADELAGIEYHAITHPYPGLRPFRAEEQPVFFGRRTQTREILEKLAQTHFAVVVGGSGSGKSSLLRAGVVPELRAKGIARRGDFWLVADFTPKDRPFDNLALAVAGVIEPSARGAAEHLAQVKESILESNSLGAVLEQYRNHLILERDQPEDTRRIANLLIICDQFEEIFRGENDAEARRQADILVNLIIDAYENRSKYPQLYIVIGMRSDDLHRSAAYVRLPNVINAASYLTRRLAQEEIAEAIIEPVRFVLRDLYRQGNAKPPQFRPIAVDSSPYQPAAMKVLYEEVAALAHDPDHLPLLQHLLSVIWNNVKDRVAERCRSGGDFQITLMDFAAALGFKTEEQLLEYRANHVGGLLALALDAEANAALRRNPDCAKTAEIMFRLLGSQDDKGSYKRRWTTRSEIAAVAGATPNTSERIRQEIEKVIKAFSTPYPFLNVSGPSGDDKIDVSHESFIRNWKQFQDWLADERQISRAFRDLKLSYLNWRRWCVDSTSSVLRRMWVRCLGRLSDDRLKSLKTWRKSYKGNAAWAERYEFRNEDRDDSVLQRGISIEQEPPLHNVNRYYSRSRALSIARRLASVGFILIAPAIIIIAYLYFGAVTKTNWARTYLIAVAAERDSSTRLQQHSFPDRFWETLIAIESFHALNHERQQPDWWMRPVSWLAGTEKIGFYSQGIQRAARASYAAMIWPHPNKVQDSTEPRYNTALPGPCGNEFEKVPPRILEEFGKRANGAKPKAILHQVPAPLEREDGAHIALVSTEADRGNYFVTIRIVEGKDEAGRASGPECQLEYIAASLPLPPGSWIVIDPNLRFVLANYDPNKLRPTDRQQDTANTFALLQRLRWLRECRGDVESGECKGTTFGYDGDSLQIQEGSAYTVTSTGLLKDTNGVFWDVHGRDKPILLDASEARTLPRPKVERQKVDLARFPYLSGVELMPANNIMCALSATHAAILTWDSSTGRLAYTLRIFEGGGNVPSVKNCDQALLRNWISKEVESKILELNFLAPTLDSLTFDEKNLDSIILHGAEVGVAYRVTWDHIQFRQDLCAALRPATEAETRAVDNLPPAKAGFSAELREMAKEADSIVHDIPLCIKKDKRFPPHG